MPQGSINKVSLSEILARVDSLPQLPEAALRLTQLMEDLDANAEDMAKVIRMDPDMTTQVLRLCNAAANGLSREVSTVKDAVAILGLKRLKSLVYVIISKIALNKPVAGYGLEPGELWYNALTGAVYARYLTQAHCKGLDPELAFTAALLRDIGKIVLGDYVGPSYLQIEKNAIGKRQDFTKAETAVLGVNHCLVGKKIAEKWKLPTSIISVIEHKNSPSAFKKAMVLKSDEASYHLITVVHLADAFVRMSGAGAGSDGLMYSLDQLAVKDLGVQVEIPFMDTMLARLTAQDYLVKDMINSLKSAG